MIMVIKVFGATLVILGCGSVGLCLCHAHRRDEKALEQLIYALEWMRLELNFRMPTISVLCKDASQVAKGVIAQLLDKFSIELDRQVTPDAGICMQNAIKSVPQLPTIVIKHLDRLGTCLGKFDLEGQITALESAEEICRSELSKLNKNKEMRFRNYRVLGFCTGIAVVLLFL